MRDDWAGQRLGQLELLRRLGSGGMGEVWLARQEGLDRRVAVKILPQAPDRRSIDRLRREAQALARIRHPHVVPVHEVGEHEGLHYYVMELVDGRSLEAVLAEGPLPAKRAAEIMRQVAEALVAAHEQGVVHRDVKPGNVLLADDRDHATLVDFGLALAESATKLTQTGDVLGTPFYMAPEQVRGDASRADARTDVWGAGATLYEMITGKKPFGEEHWLAVQMAVLELDPEPPRRLRPDCPADLESIVLRCLEKDPARRYPTARALADDLARVLADEPIRAEQPPPPRPRRGRAASRRRRIAGWIAAAAALLAVLGLALWRCERRGAARDRESAEAAELLRVALALVERGDTAEAWTKLREVELRFPHAPAVIGACWAMADLERRGRDEDDVLAQATWLDRLLEADPPAADAARAHWQLGRIYDKHGFVDDARDHYAKAAAGGALAPAELADARFGLAWTEWRGRRIDSGVAATVLGAGDLDGDGHDEVLAYEPPRTLAAFGLRAGRLEVVRRWELPELATPGRLAMPPRLADVDGDGRPELIIAVADECIVGDLSGPAVRRVLTFDHCYRILPGDLDGDGRPELVLARGQPRELRLVRVAPDRSTREAVLDDLAVDESYVTGLDIADLDGDGRAELIYANGAWTRYDVRVARLDGDALRVIARAQLGLIDGLDAIYAGAGRREIFAVKSHVAANPRLFDDDPYLGPSGPMVLRLIGDRLERTWLDPLVPATGAARALYAAARSRRTSLGPLAVVASPAAPVIHLYFSRSDGAPIRRDLRRSIADLDGGAAIADLDGDGAGELVLGGARVTAHGIGAAAAEPRRDRPRTGEDWLAAARRLRDAREPDLALDAYRDAAARGADPTAVAFEEGLCHAQAGRWDLALGRFRNARTAGRRDPELWRAMLEAAEAAADWDTALEAARALGDATRTAAIEQLRARRTTVLQDFAEPWRPGWRVEQPLACRGPTAGGAVGLTLLPGERALALPIDWDGSSIEVSAVIALRDVQYGKGIGIELARDDGQRVSAGTVGGDGGGGALSLYVDLYTPERTLDPQRSVDWSVFPERVALSLSYVAHTGRWQVALRDLAGKVLARASARGAARPAAGRHAIQLIGPVGLYLAASIVDVYRLEVRAAPGAVTAAAGAASGAVADPPPPRCARDLAPPGAAPPLHRAFALAAAGNLTAASAELAAWRPAAAARPAPRGFELEAHRLTEWEAGLVRLALLDEPLASAIVDAGRLLPPRDWGVLLRRLAYQQHVDSGQTHWGEATLTLRRATALAPDDADAWYMLGYCRYRLGDLAAARTAFERAATLDPAIERRYPKQGGPALFLARIAARERDPDAAARWLAEAARLGGNLAIARHDRGLRDLLGVRLGQLAGDAGPPSR